MQAGCKLLPWLRRFGCRVSTNEKPCCGFPDESEVGQPSESRVRDSGNIRPTREPFPELPGSWQWTIGRKMNCLHRGEQRTWTFRGGLRPMSEEGNMQITFSIVLGVFQWLLMLGNYLVFFLNHFSLVWSGGSCHTITAHILRILDWLQPTPAHRTQCCLIHSVKCFIKPHLIKDDLISRKSIFGMSYTNIFFTQSASGSIRI